MQGTGHRGDWRAEKPNKEEGSKLDTSNSRKSLPWARGTKGRRCCCWRPEAVVTWRKLEPQWVHLVGAGRAMEEVQPWRRGQSLRDRQLERISLAHAVCRGQHFFHSEQGNGKERIWGQAGQDWHKIQILLSPNIHLLILHQPRVQVSPTSEDTHLCFLSSLARYSNFLTKNGLETILSLSNSPPLGAPWHVSWKCGTKCS